MRVRRLSHDLLIHVCKPAVMLTLSVIDGRPHPCRYLRGFYTGTNLHCLVSEAQGCEQLVSGYCAAVLHCESNLRPLVSIRKSDVLPVALIVIPVLIYFSISSLYQSFFSILFPYQFYARKLTSMILFSHCTVTVSLRAECYSISKTASKKVTTN